jgi:hypothetical protein
MLNRNTTKPQAKSVVRRDYSPTKKPNTNLFKRENFNKTPSHSQALSSRNEPVYKQIQTRTLNIDKLLDDESTQTSAFDNNFQDIFFPCTNQSLSNDFRNSLNIDWLRPHEISETFLFCEQ